MRMAGQPSIYKMPKDIFIGARPLLKPVEYTWWPPKQFANASIGQFDIYPAAWDPQALSRLLQDPPQQQQASPAGIEELYPGCVVVRSFQTLH